MKIKDILKYCNGELIGDANINIEITNFSIDSRNVNENSIFVPLKGENSDGHQYIKNAFENGAIATLTNEKIEKTDGKVIIKVEDTLKAIQDIAKNFRIEHMEIPLVAITGSVGKTITKDMTYAVLSKKYKTLKTKGNFNNNIGMPISLANYNNEEIIVLEMGMNSLGEISFLSNIAKPNVSAIINIGHSHIEHLKTRENILKAKLEILEGMNEDGVLLLNMDNDMLQNVKNIKQNIITFGIKNNADIVAYNINVKNECTTFCIKENNIEYLVEINLSGEQFVYNALVAWTIGKIYNVMPKERIEALKQCDFTKMRLNIENVNDITIIDDCYNAGPESMKVALQILSRQNSKRKVAILGDMLELGTYSKDLHKEVGKIVANLKIDKLLVNGRFSKYIIEGAVNNGMPMENIIFFEKIEDLIKKVNTYIKKEDAVLIKASRAMQFERIIKKIKEGGN